MKWINTGQFRRQGNERGIILVMTALSGVCLLGMAALAVDISHSYLVGSELQNAADAAALAGAAELNGYASGITNARKSATQLVNKYDFSVQSVNVTQNDVHFATNLTDFSNGKLGYSEAEASAMAARIRFVMVKLAPHDVGVHFANFFLQADNIQMSKTAIAGLSVSGVGGDVGLTRICNFVPLAVVQDPATGAPLNPNPECPDKTAFTPGCTYTIRGGSQNSVSAGNYQVLAITGENGGGDARSRMAGGVHYCYQPGSYIESEPGVKACPITQGLNTRFGDYGQGLDATTYPPDSNLMEGITYEQYRSKLPQYTQSSGPYGVDNRRIIVLPIIDADEFSGGRTSVRIRRYAPFFLRGKVQGSGDLVAEYINRPVMVGSASYIPSDLNSGSPSNSFIATPVLYR